MSIKTVNLDVTLYKYKDTGLLFAVVTPAPYDNIHNTERMSETVNVCFPIFPHISDKLSLLQARFDKADKACIEADDTRTHALAALQHEKQRNDK